VPQSWRIHVGGGAERNIMELLSPDRRWFAGLKDNNLWLRSTDDGHRLQITTDGVLDHEWKVEGARWSPDSLKLVVKKVDNRRVHAIPIVHWLDPMEEVTWVREARAGGPFSQAELFIVDTLSKRQVRIDTGEEPDQHFHILGWRPDGSELLFLRLDRESKRMDLMAADPSTSSARVILTETQKTFVMGWEFVHVDRMDWLRTITLLEDGKRFIWVSERDGWKHLYLYNIEGALIRRLTKGAFPVVRVETVDEKAGWIYFTAHADRQRPYDTHLYRVSLEGREFMQLTEGTGQHDIQFAPSRKFFLDTHSSVARPPAVDLLRADGTLQQTLSKANIDALKTHLKWNPPEEFVVKAADGQTKLYGVLYKPYDFDPNKKYPVIESIYAGPQFTLVPHTFIRNWGGVVDAQALAQLGFIVFIVDGRGTPERGKAFQDVVYRNIGRHEIPDHVAALNQLAEKRPYINLNRVGIYGGSGGGYFTIRAMLQAPDVYHVGIATNACGERSDHGPGEVFYMGLPENNKEGYEYGSNIRLVGNLKGKLLLIQSTSDPHGTFAWAMKLVEALIRAGKAYDLLVLPEQPHWLFDGAILSVRYVQEATRRYFQEHLKPELSK
ncbi:MAG: DPP IV N-terminal domain-containing protein, partial [Candidatus Binatia bacterium]